VGIAIHSDEEIDGPVLEEQFKVVTLVAPALTRLLVGIELRDCINTKVRYHDWAFFEYRRFSRA